MKHTKLVHKNCNKPYYEICDGKLFICTVCGGAEGSLLPECPGRMLSIAEDEENYRKYCAGEPPFDSLRPASEDN